MRQLAMKLLTRSRSLKSSDTKYASERYTIVTTKLANASDTKERTNGFNARATTDVATAAKRGRRRESFSILAVLNSRTYRLTRTSNSGMPMTFPDSQASAAPKAPYNGTKIRPQRIK